MKKFYFALKCLLCLMCISFFAYKYIDRVNLVTEMRRKIPALAKKMKRIDEENIRLQYELDKLENPSHLMRFSRMKEFQYLKYPSQNEVMILNEQ